MRIVLQHAGTGLYMKALGVWTADLADAYDYGSSLRAIKFMRQQRLSGVQVVVAFVQPSFIDSVALQLPGKQSISQGPSTVESEGVQPAA